MVYILSNVKSEVVFAWPSGLLLLFFLTFYFISHLFLVLSSLLKMERLSLHFGLCMTLFPEMSESLDVLHVMHCEVL